MISEDSAAGRAGSAGRRTLADTIAARLARAGIDPHGRELAFIAAWNANVRALRGTPGHCGWPTCPERIHPE